MQAEDVAVFLRSSEDHQLWQIKVFHDDNALVYTVAKLSKRNFSLWQLRVGGGGQIRFEACQRQVPVIYSATSISLMHTPRNIRLGIH
jgi:hypothetical protein